MRKHFTEQPNDYRVILTVDAGGRVAGTLWTSTILLTKDFELISYTSSKTRATTNNHIVVEPDMSEVKLAITYAKGQIKNMSKVVKTTKILVKDVYGMGICIKEVDLTVSGTPSLKQAGSRVQKCDIKPLTDKIQAEMDATEAYKEAVRILRADLYEAEQALKEELNAIWEGN